MPDTTRSPRAVLVATLTTGLLAIQYAAADATDWQFQEHGVGNDGSFVSTAVVRTVKPFSGGLFHPDANADSVISWLVGVAVAVAVAWLVIVVVTRKGSLAAFVGGWFAVILATWAGSLASAYVWGQIADYEIGIGQQTQLLSAAFDDGLHWGFLFGWFPALVAALLAGVLHKREVTPVEPTQPTEQTGPTSEKGPEPRMM